MARINLIKIRQGPPRDFYNTNSNNKNSNNKDSKSNFLQIDGPTNEMLF